MACILPDGYDLPCILYSGGIKGFWILGGTLSSPGYTTGGTPSAITGITGSGTFYAFNTEEFITTFTEDKADTINNSTVAWTGTLTVRLPRNQAATRNNIAILASNRYLKIVFVDENDQYWCMGFNRGANLSTANSTTGAALSDFNGYTLVFKYDDSVPVLPITEGSTLTSVTTGITVETLASR